MNVFLNNKIIDYTKTHIVLEAGPTHNGLKSAKSLVKMAHDSNADSIKFQMADVERLMAKNKNVPFKYSYLKKTNKGDIFIEKVEPLSNILKRRELSKKEWIELKNYCDELDIHFFSTACFEDEVDFLVDELNVDSIKIASSDITNISFIKYCAKKKINIQIDTGSADLWEIEKAVIAIEEENNSNIIIHHCPSGYPARLQSINLKMITTLKQMFPNYLIAFSDHTKGWEMDIAAVTLGAGMIEKTITENKYFESCEHSFSLEKNEIENFISSIRNLEIALGDARRIFPKEEKLKRKNTRRSPYALRDIEIGEKIKYKDIEFKRPQDGISDEELSFYLDSSLTKKIKKGQVISKDLFH
ncbi:N-acetylneuraminate synthase family protein [Flavobacteriaceae bacterium]|nr:N-acetylneuraminate synthase family protein [Flavobacteriaceae bacterium]